MHEKYLIILLAVFVVILASGCVKESTPGPNEVTTTTAIAPVTSTIVPVTTTTEEVSAGLKTCAQEGGHTCESGETCEGNWLDASDTFHCCSELCQSEEELEVEPFDLESEESDEIGDIV